MNYTRTLTCTYTVEETDVHLCSHFYTIFKYINSHSSTYTPIETVITYTNTCTPTQTNKVMGTLLHLHKRVYLNKHIHSYSSTFNLHLNTHIHSNA